MTNPSAEPNSFEDLQEFFFSVREWFEENAVIPANIPMPSSGQPMADELKQWAVQFRRKLGNMGWIAPDWPVEYGGGGLSKEHSEIIRREMRRHRLPTLQVSIMHTVALRMFASEEHKKTILASILRGEVSAVHAFNEIKHGSDLGANTTAAVRDGDEYLITGQKDYITSLLPPDLIFCLALTNPDAPPAKKFSLIAVDAKAPGIDIKAENLLVPGREYKFLFTEAQVHRTQIIGEEGQGIEIAELMLGIERGGIISIPLAVQEDVEDKEQQELGH
jgi:alkylation response protein AidB-like acyl-CoA dehydrogenase